MSTLSLLFETDLLSQPSRVVPQGLHEIIQFDTNFFLFLIRKMCVFVFEPVFDEEAVCTLPPLHDASPVHAEGVAAHLEFLKNIGKTLAWNFS